MQTTLWKEHKVKIMEEIQDPKYGRVLWAYVDYVKEYIIDDKVVEDQTIIDYLDDNYGRPTAWRDMVF